MDGQNVHNEEGKFKVEEEIIEEDKEQNLFSGVKSTLSWTQLEKTLEEISVTCRFSLNTFAKEKTFLCSGQLLGVKSLTLNIFLLRAPQT